MVDKDGEEYPGDEIFGAYTDDGEWGWKCPYGQVGSRLWVRETHYHYGNWKPTGEITKTGKIEWEFVPSDYRRVNYSDNPPSEYLTKPSYLMGWYKRVSMFMPRWASRITREITAVRVERLRAISEADAKAEGGYTIEEFIELFIKINHLSENADPWNWVLGW